MENNEPIILFTDDELIELEKDCSKSNSILIPRLLETYKSIISSTHYESYMALSETISTWNKELTLSSNTITFMSEDKSFDRALKYISILGDLNEQLSKIRNFIAIDSTKEVETDKSKKTKFTKDKAVI